MSDEIEKVHPFDSFSAVYKILGWAGYYRVNKPTSGFKRILHQIYRLLAFLIAAIYNVQHLIFTAQNRHDVDKLMDCLTIEIPQMNLLTKLATLFYYTSRIDKLNSFLRDDNTFHATDEEAFSILRSNKKEMHRLCRVLMTNVTIAAFIWPGSFFVRRYTDPRESVPTYVPFETDSWVGFSWSVILESCPMLWIGYGHIAMDVLVSTFYAHAQAQLKIIKHQLEHYVDEGKDDGYYLKSYFKYRDLTDQSVNARFIRIVKRYEKLVWYKTEVDSIFNFSLSFQFFSTTSTVCLVIYRMTVVSITSFPFVFLLVLFCILLTQVFIYCYYGNLVEFESRSVNNAVYNSDWLSMSPSFRRQMLIAMSRWTQPIQPRVCGIIPLSLNTFITIVKSSYTLYTMLVTAKINGN